MILFHIVTIYSDVLLYLSVYALLQMLSELLGSQETGEFTNMEKQETKQK